MLDLAFESFWLWYLAGVTLWAFIGMLIAARFSLPVMVGVGLGGLFWIGGVVVLLVLGFAHRGRHGNQERTTFRPGPSTGTSAAFPATGPGFGTASSFAGFPSSGTEFPPSGGFPERSEGFPPAGAYSSVTRSGSAAGFSPDPFGTVPTASGSLRGISTGSASMPTAPRTRGHLTFPKSTEQIALAVAGVGALGILVSIVLPWGEGSVAWSRTHSTVSGGVSPSSAYPVAFVIALSGVVVLGSGLFMRRRPHIIWPMLAAATTTWWFCVVFEWLFVESHVASLTGSADDLAGRSAAVSLSTAPGVWIMLVACCAVFAWCALVTYDLVRSNPARMSDFANPRQAA